MNKADELRDIANKAKEFQKTQEKLVRAKIETKEHVRVFDKCYTELLVQINDIAKSGRFTYTFYPSDYFEKIDIMVDGNTPMPNEAELKRKFCTQLSIHLEKEGFITKTEAYGEEFIVHISWENLKEETSSCPYCTLNMLKTDVQSHMQHCSYRD